MFVNCTVIALTNFLSQTIRIFDHPQSGKCAFLKLVNDQPKRSGNREEEFLKKS